MKGSTAILAILALAAGFALGRATAPALDPELSSIASFRRALNDPDWLTRSYRYSGFLQGLDPENLPEAVAALEPHLPWLPTDELRIFMLAWSRFDPFGAFTQALEWPRPFNRNAAGAALYAWAMRNPGAASWALKSLDDPELEEFLEGRLVAGWVHGEHKQSASDYIASLPEGPRRFGYIGKLAWELSKSGPEAVMRWAEAVPDDHPRYKAAVFLQASNTLTAGDPAGTARWLAGHLDRPYADGVLRVVARSWATSDPTAALPWLMQLPDGEKRDGTISHAFSVWLGRSPEDAEAWLRGATPAPALDPALRLMVRRAGRDSPSAALEWAAAIDDAALRERAVANVARRWLRADPEAARNWLAQSDLSGDVRAAILDPAAREGGGEGNEGDGGDEGEWELEEGGGEPAS